MVCTRIGKEGPMRFFNPLGFLALLGIPLVLLMYLLKQKYRETKVPSLFLWEKAVARTQAHQPWQKLRKNLLMALQIGAIALLGIGLANPYILNGTPTQNYVIALDCSLSMQAEDETQSRFQAAKSEIRKLVEEAPPETGFTVISVGEAPYVSVSRTTDKKLVLNKIQSMKVTNGGADWEDALALLTIEKEQFGGTVKVFTDAAQDLGELSAEQVVFGKKSENCAVTLFSHTSSEDGLQVMSKIKNFGSQTQERTVTLFCDDAVFDLEDIRLGAGEEKDVVFTGIPLKTETLTVRLTPEDILKADDVAYDGAFARTGKKVLLVTEQNIFLEKVFALLPEVELYKTEPDHVENLKGYSLYIFDAVLPKELPKDGHIMVWNPPIENDLIHLGNEKEGVSTVKGIGHGALASLGDVAFDIAKARPISDFSWGQGILDWNGETVAVAGEKDGKKITAFSFDLHQSDLPLKKEFPIFMYQLFHWYFPGNVHNLESVTADQPIEFQLLPETKGAAVVTPSGKRFNIAPPFPADVFYETEETGTYILEQKDEAGEVRKSPFAVNPKTDGESDLMMIQEKADSVGENPKTVFASRSLRNVILLLLLCLLLVEWRVSCHER